MTTSFLLLPASASQSLFYKLLVVSVLVLGSARLHHAHNDGAPASPCNSDQGVTVEAAFRPGIVTVDADYKDWADVEGHQFPLLPALNPDPSQKFPMDSGSIQIKAVHDGRDVFFNLEVPGDYVFTAGEPTSTPAVALMFGVGDDATYHNMGGCPQRPDNCSSTSCHGYEVDIMQFSISNAIPGRLYGSNILDNVKGTGADRFGNLNDLFGWSPHCTYTDGSGPDGIFDLQLFNVKLNAYQLVDVHRSAVEGSLAQNDWQGAWTHTSISLEYGLVKADSPFGADGTKGFYIFEFARPLRTNDHLQQDVQFTIGGTFPFGAVVWYPVDGRPWSPSQHYSANCAWIPLKLSAASSSSLTSFKAVDILSIVSIFVALAALSTTLVLGWWVKSNNPRPGFQGIPNL